MIKVYCTRNKKSCTFLLLLLLLLSLLLLLLLLLPLLLLLSLIFLFVSGGPATTFPAFSNPNCKGLLVVGRVVELVR